MGVKAHGHGIFENRLSGRMALHSMYAGKALATHSVHTRMRRCECVKLPSSYTRKLTLPTKLCSLIPVSMPARKHTDSKYNGTSSRAFKTNNMIVMFTEFQQCPNVSTRVPKPHRAAPNAWQGVARGSPGGPIVRDRLPNSALRHHARHWSTTCNHDGTKTMRLRNEGQATGVFKRRAKPGDDRAPRSHNAGGEFLLFLFFPPSTNRHDQTYV